MAVFIKTAQFGQSEQLLGNILKVQVGIVVVRVFYPFNHQSQAGTVCAGNMAQIDSDVFGGFQKGKRF